MSVEMTDLNKAGDESKINRAVTWKTGKEYNPLNHGQSQAHADAQPKKWWSRWRVFLFLRVLLDHTFRWQLCASRTPGTWQRNGNEWCHRTSDPLECQLNGTTHYWGWTFVLLVQHFVQTLTHFIPFSRTANARILFVARSTWHLS